MTGPDHAAFHRTYEAYAVVRKRHEELMRDAIAGKVQVTLEESMASAHDLMEALRTWQATYPGIVGYGP